MTRLTYHVVLPFSRNDEGELCPGEPVECPSPAAATVQAQRLAARLGGAVAFSRTGDPDLGDYNDAVVMARVGDVPMDLEAAAGAL